MWRPVGRFASCHNRVAKGGVLMMLTTGFAFITVKLEVIKA